MDDDFPHVQVFILGALLAVLLSIGGYYLEEWIVGPCEKCGLMCNDCECFGEIQDGDR